MILQVAMIRVTSLDETTLETAYPLQDIDDGKTRLTSLQKKWCGFESRLYSQGYNSVMVAY